MVGEFGANVPYQTDQRDSGDDTVPSEDYPVRMNFDIQDTAVIKRAAGILGRQIKPLAEQVFLDYCRKVVEEDRRTQTTPQDPKE
jgi:hypothetical protein